jgi:sugar phosphate isomerase/epimerase
MMYESRSWNVALGEGLIDWKALRDAAEAQGVEAYVNEREYYHISGNPDGDPYKAAELDCKFMRSIFG